MKEMIWVEMIWISDAGKVNKRPGIEKLEAWQRLFLNEITHQQFYMLNKVNYRNIKNGAKSVQEMCSSVSLYNFEQVFVYWDIFLNINWD